MACSTATRIDPIIEVEMPAGTRKSTERRYFALKKEIAAALKTAERYAIERQHLQMKVQHLSDLSLDADLLDERARVVLNMAADDEFIILDKDI